MTYKDAMERYGSDKPDTRFEMEIKNLSHLVENCEFGVFTNAINNGGSVRAIVAENSASIFTRKEIDKLTEMVRGIGAKGLAYIRWIDEKPTCSFSKFMSEEEINIILTELNCKQGDVVFIVADKNSVTLPVLGALRLKVAKQLDIIPNTFNFLWITEFPFFEWDEDNNSWVAMHHPFTMPSETIQYLETDPGKVIAKAYDLVLNGVELSSGSIRILIMNYNKECFKHLGTDEKLNLNLVSLLKLINMCSPWRTWDWP